MVGRRSSMALVGLLVGAAALMTGCSSTAPSARPGTTAPPTDTPSSGAVSTSPPAPSVSEAALIYAAVLGGHSDTASGLRRIVYLRDRFCTGMVSIDKRGPCEPGPIPPALRRELGRLVGPNLRITANPPPPGRPYSTSRSVDVQLGTITRVGPTARVAVDWHCGPMCGQGETLVLGKRGGTWVVTGRTGFSWIS
jgi:hypothetical protein